MLGQLMNVPQVIDPLRITNKEGGPSNLLQEESFLFRSQIG